GEYLLIIIVFFSISYTQKMGGHISVGLLVHKFSDGAKRIIKIFTNLLALLLIGALATTNYQKAMTFFERDVRSESLLHYPLAPAYLIIFIGLTLLALRLLLESINLILEKKQIPYSITHQKH